MYSLPMDLRGLYMTCMSPIFLNLANDGRDDQLHGGLGNSHKEILQFESLVWYDVISGNASWIFDGIQGPTKIVQFFGIFTWLF